MATEDKRTKAELLEELAEAHRQIRDAKSDAYDAHQSLPSAPVAVPEAEALAACIRAIDRMHEAVKSQNRSTGYNYSSDYRDYSRREIGDVERILRSLAARHGIELVEVRTDPCSRRHVDEISPDQIMFALHGGNR